MSIAKIKNSKHIILLPPTLLVILGATLFVSAGHDDSFITYWASYSLVHYGAILNYNGDYVEQSSSLLHVLILAFAYGLTGIKLIILGKFSSILAGAWSVLAIHKLAHSINPKIAMPTALLTATSTFLIYWSYGGLETTIATLLIIWLIQIYGDYLHNKPIKRRKIVTISGAFLLVRPELPIVLACVLIATLLFTLFKTGFSTEIRKIVLIIGLAIFATCILMAFRFIYFDSLFPQPVYVKGKVVSFFKPFTLQDIKFLRTVLISDGVEVFIFWARKFIDMDTWQYSYKHFIQLFPNAMIGFFMLCGLGYSLWRQLRAKSPNFYLLFIFFFVISYMVFNFLTGGDWMIGGRFWVPILPLIWLGVPYFIYTSVSRLWFLYSITVIFLVMQVYHLWQFTKTDSLGIPIWSQLRVEAKFTQYDKNFGYTPFEYYNRDHARDIPLIYYLKPVIETIKAHKNNKVRILSRQMGMIPYYITQDYFGDIAYVDTGSLVTRYLTHCELDKKSDIKPIFMFDYKYYFENKMPLHKLCHIPDADIIYDLNWAIRRSKLMASYSLEDKKEYYQNNFPNYTLIYLQTGDMVIDTTRLQGDAKMADEFILVRDDWLKVMQFSKLIYLELK